MRYMQPLHLQQGRACRLYCLPFQIAHVQSGREARQGENDTRILWEQPLDPFPGPLTYQLLSFSAPQTSVQSHSCLVVKRASTTLEFQEGLMHSSLHITVPVAQNTGKGKNTNSNTSGGSLPGYTVSCARGGGLRGGPAAKRPCVFIQRQAPEEHPKASTLYPSHTPFLGPRSATEG